MYLAGGMKIGVKSNGAAVTRNLTPDPEAGLGNIMDDEVKRVLRSGVFRDGRRMHHRQEDRRAVVTYLRQIKPVKHKIPDPRRDATLENPDAADYFFGRDFGIVANGEHTVRSMEVTIDVTAKNYRDVGAEIGKP